MVARSCEGADGGGEVREMQDCGDPRMQQGEAEGRKHVLFSPSVCGEEEEKEEGKEGFFFLICRNWCR